MSNVSVYIKDGDDFRYVGGANLRREYRGVVKKDGLREVGIWCRTMEDAAAEAFAVLGSEAEFAHFESRYVGNLGDYESEPRMTISSAEDEDKAIEAGRAAQAAWESVESEDA